MSFYIKLNKSGAPVEHPLEHNNLKSILDGVSLTDAVVTAAGYALFEHTPIANGQVQPAQSEYVVGTDGVVREVPVAQTLTQAEKLEVFIRRPRGFLLTKADWVDSSYAQMSDEKRAEWSVYRQALRALTQVFSAVEHAAEVVWPVQPDLADLAFTPVVRLQQKITQQAQARLDAFASARGYDSMLSLCTYATSTVPQFASEGQQGVNGRDATWAALYNIMKQVEAGTRPMPASFADIEAELPVLAW